LAVSNKKGNFVFEIYVIKLKQTTYEKNTFSLGRCRNVVLGCGAEHRLGEVD
jgi:hypothetical protein